MRTFDADYANHNNHKQHAFKQSRVCVSAQSTIENSYEELCVNITGIYDENVPVDAEEVMTFGKRDTVIR